MYPHMTLSLPTCRRGGVEERRRTGLQCCTGKSPQNNNGAVMFVGRVVTVGPPSSEGTLCFLCANYCTAVNRQVRQRRWTVAAGGKMTAFDVKATTMNLLLSGVDLKPPSAWSNHPVLQKIHPLHLHQECSPQGPDNSSPPLPRASTFFNCLLVVCVCGGWGRGWGAVRVLSARCRRRRVTETWFIADY